MIRRFIVLVIGIGLFVIISNLYFGKFFIDLGLSIFAKHHNLEVTYEIEDSRLFAGTFRLSDVRLNRPAPHLLDVNAEEVSGQLDMRYLPMGKIVFKTIDLFDVDGQIVTQNVTIPFQFNSISFHPLHINQLFESILFKSTVKGTVWDGKVNIGSNSLEISDIPVEHINKIFGKPLRIFKYGRLGVKTSPGWKDVEGKKMANLDFRMHSFQTKVPSTVSGMEKVLISQLTAYLQAQEVIEFSAPVYIDPNSFDGKLKHDAGWFFGHIGTQLAAHLPQQLGAHHTTPRYTNNIFNLSDEKIESIQDTLQSYLD